MIISGIERRRKEMGRDIRTLLFLASINEMSVGSCWRFIEPFLS